MEYVCMPLVRNIQSQGNSEWRLTACPYCGSTCLDRPVDFLTEERIREHKAVKVCTECAIKKAVNPKRMIRSYREMKAVRRGPV